MRVPTPKEWGVILGSLINLASWMCNAMSRTCYDLLYTVTDGRYGWPRSHEPQRTPTLLIADVPQAKSGIVCRCPIG